MLVLQYRQISTKELLVEISELVFAQTCGIFFVWRTRNREILITFLRNKADVPSEVQIENAIDDGSRRRKWTLIGVGHWHHCPIKQHSVGPTETGIRDDALPSYTITAAPLRMKKLFWKEMRSTSMGMQEMREKWIPYICEQLRKILQEEGRK
jgi:hypothetical protein